jgi:hypothetical protein
VTGIQRWIPFLATDNDNGRDYHVARQVPRADGEWVKHTDHIATLRQAEQRGDQRYIAGHADGYEQGQRDALAALRVDGACACQCGKASHAIKGQQ